MTTATDPLLRQDIRRLGRLLGDIHLAINGIAAGLRNSG